MIFALANMRSAFHRRCLKVIMCEHVMGHCILCRGELFTFASSDGDRSLAAGDELVTYGLLGGRDLHCEGIYGKRII